LPAAAFIGGLQHCQLSYRAGKLTQLPAFLPCLFAFLAYGQSLQRNEIAFDGGYAWQANVPGGLPRLTAVSVGGTYSFRFRPWLALEAGVLTANNPTGVINSEFGSFDIHDRYTWVPFGVRFIPPLRGGRFELSAGGGGVYERYGGGNTTPAGYGSSYNGEGGYFKARAAVALDPGRHFWLGATLQFFVVNGLDGARDRWFVLTGDIGFRL
jgi:hypothetical protein